MQISEESVPTLSWSKALISEAATLQDAIRNLNETTLQIALVVSSKRELIGTLTDGDIRRGLLRGMDLKSTVDAIINRTPLVGTPELGRETVLRLMQANKIHQLPIVDEGMRVVGLHLWDDLITPRKRANVMIVMAGGKGTRLRPHTESCPKPLLPVGGKPMLEHIVERAKAEGINHFVFAI